MATGIISPNVYSDEEEAAIWESTALNGGDVKKQLLPDFSVISPASNVPSCSDSVQTPAETSQEDRIKIYLRVRPFTEAELEKGESQGCVLIENSETLVLRAPKDSFAMRSCERGIGQAMHKFTFSQIFDPETSQKLFFDVVMKNLVKESLEGQNCLVYTYGVSNSGKTYTIQGTRQDNGILPRSLAVIFNSIQGKLYPRLDLKPNLCNDVIKLDNKMVRQEELKKLSLLGIVREEDLQTPMKKNPEFRLKEGLSCDSDSGIGGMSSVSNFEETASRWADHDTVVIQQEEHIQYSIWVSFFEIYNELAYDLLDTAPTANRKRQTLKLCEDKNGNTYVKDLTWINVGDAEEAWKILKVGRKNQSIASTHVNQNSSRSHSIFSIRIIHVSEDWKSILQTSELTLCDLAGSERCKEQKCGSRLKEATNINTSLHTLGRCISALRQNQQIKSKPNVVPFRDSKLTRVFQGFFANHGKSCMIVNINQCASTYDETLQVMKFSAIASQLIQAPSMKLFPSIRSLLREHDGWNNCNAQEPVEEQEEYDDEEENDNEDDPDISTLDKESLQKIIECLQQHLIKEKQEKLLMESEIRQSVVSEMMEQYNAMERHWSEQLEEQKDRLEDAFEAKMKNYQEYVKFYYQQSSAEEESSESDDEMCDGKALTKKIHELEATIQQLKAERKSACQPKRQSARLASTSLRNELHAVQLELVNTKTELEQSKAEAAFNAEELKRYKEMVEPPAGVKHLTINADRKLEEGQRHAKALQKELQKIEQVLQTSERACCHNTEAEKLRHTLAKCEDLMLKQDHTLAELQKVMILLKLDMKRKNACIAEQYHTVRQLQEGPGCNKRRCAGNIENQPPQEKKPFLTGLLTPLRRANLQRGNTPSTYILRSRAKLDKPLHRVEAKYQVNY
ncbi:kinesin-like protein KIF20A [Pristis pectinata]|uniref:kinesin-like protein KIF20A n=1 Tax=Pristis pectinata TaxID=685728 RepID=UPI00223E3668|nr:kinesin-like protein KIF20A [Pristis pectinata]XP_051870594.1 kinesin-like protein KIF20A [Pristis pectinata]